MNKVGEMALQAVTLTLKLSLKMPFFADWWGKLLFCYLQDRRFYRMEAHVFQNFFLRWDLTFPVKRGIKLPIGVRHRHVLVARFSKNQVYISRESPSKCLFCCNKWKRLVGIDSLDTERSIIYTSYQIPRETVSFVFPRVLMFPETKSRETSGLEGKQN